MKESVILQMRSTIFMTCFISYTEEAKVQYSDLLPDAHPEAFLPSDPLNQNSLAPTEYGPWKLTNGNLSINFGQGRVDIEQKIVVEPDSAEIFLRKCKEIFKAIVTRESKKNASIRIFRFAFAPVIAFDFNNDETKDSIASKLFVNNKFKDSDFDNAELSAAFKVQEKLDDKFINMNYYHLILTSMM